MVKFIEDFSSAMAAICVSAAIATIIMGVYANYPIALAPGMGENAFFTYTVCHTLGHIDNGDGRRASRSREIPGDPVAAAFDGSDIFEDEPG